MYLVTISPAGATIISSVISALIAITVIFINKWFEKRSAKQKKYDVFKKYANPIISSCEQLSWRIKEILEYNGTYLLPNAPQNDYFKYKFDSTVYRLCAVLGWIRASKKEQSYFECAEEQDHAKIQKAISDFKKSLADGSHVEVSILEELIKLFNIKSEKLKNKELMAAELESIMFNYIPNNNAREVIGLENNIQIIMLKEILDYICNNIKHSTIPEGIIREKRESAINEISRYYCWIYRDWQSAIGDLMLLELNNANRRFDVIGFGDFQEKYRENKWVKKVDVLFSSLDVSIDDRFDARVKQLKKLYCSCISLIEALKAHINKPETITEESFKVLEQFKDQLNC